MPHELEHRTPTLEQGEGDTAGPRRGYPLTALQGGMLFHEVRGIRGVDLEQIVCRTPERIEPAAFTQALASLTAMHPVLRTRFLWDTGAEPRQEIVDGVEPAVRFLDRSTVPAGARALDFRQQLLADRQEGLSLADAPLIRGTVLQYGPGDTRILLTVHHAIVDGRCFPVLLEDLFRCHAAHRRGIAAPTAPQRLEFRRFAEWSASQDFESRSRAFWTERLRGFTAPTPLMVDGLPDRGADPLHWQEEITLSPSETAALESLAQSTEVTVHALVQAAWALLLSRYASETDVVFGGTRACRKSSIDGVDDAIGLFINTLPVRASLDPDKPLTQLATELRAQWVAMRPHEHTPLGRVQAWSDIEKGQSLFESILVFENFDLGEVMQARGGEWTQREVELYERTNFPLTVAAYHGTERLRLKVEFDQERFSLATVQRLLGHLRSLLVQFPAAPDAALRTFRLTTPAELQALHAVWASPTEYPVPGTLAEWYAMQVERTPDRIALSFGSQSWTYRELDVASNRVASMLVAVHGVQRGDIVGLCVERSAEIVIGILGILKAGAAYLPIDLAYPADRLRWMLEDSAAPVLLTQQALVHTLPETTATVVTFEAIEAAGDSSGGTPVVPSHPDDLAYVIFTSGSTGKPKGCRITNRNVARLMTATEQYYHFGEHDVWTLFHSFAFDFSVWEIWGALLYGGRVVVVPYDVTRSPDDFHALLVREQVTVLNQTPSAFRQLIAADERSTAAPSALALRYVIFGGEALELESLRTWFDRHGDQQPQLVNMYGITETTVHVTYRPIGRADLASGSVIGRQIPDLEIHLLDPAGHPVPVGVPGEIHVGGAGVAAGYLNRPELTAARFLPHPFRGGETLYRTGDVARFLPTQDLEYLGRSDDQVKIRGFRIELGEIQSVLARHPAVREAFVTVLGTGAEKRIVAYVVGDREAATLKALREHAGESMPPYMIPSAIVFVDRFPLTNNGKVDRKALPRPEDVVRPGDGAAFQPPQGETETILAGILARALKLPRVGRDEDYFELGGDSILSIQVVSQARRAGLKLTPRDLFERRTVGQLALVAQPIIAAAAPVAAAPPGGAAPLTPIQHWFFRHRLPDPNHWTQSFLFDLATPLTTAALRPALEALVRHHAALRTAFRTGEQVVQDAPVFAFREVTEAIDDTVLTATCLEAQRALRIGEGTMLSVVLFTGRRQLYLAIHHLAVDGVSWRILLEDLEALLTGTALDPVPTPFVQWAQHVQSLATDPAITAQRDYWAHQAGGFRLQPFVPAVTTTAGESRSITVRLSREDTERLTSVAVPAARAQLDEVLVASVAGAIAQSAGVDALAIDLEGHGRREASPLDLSRTVGWFTTIYPLALTTGRDPRLADLIERTKVAMRAVPERGFAFGLLGPVEPTRDVLFNFLGRFDQVTADSTLFAFAKQDSGSWYDAGSSRAHLLEVNSWIKDGCLEFTWTFAALPQAMVAAMAKQCADALRTLASGAGEPAAPRALAAPQSQATIDGDVEAVLPLTPMQQLYYTLEMARPGAALDQWHWTLTGRADADAVRGAFEHAAARHAALRTEFHGRGMVAPVQVVRPRVSIPVSVVQIASDAEFEALLAADAAKGLRIDAAPLMRLTLVEMAGAPTRVIWTHHHLQIDGWSWPLLLADVSAAYRAITEGREPALEPVPSIGDYLRWYQSVDLEPSRTFWRDYLMHFREPTAISSQARGTATFSELSATLGDGTTSQLTAIAKRLRCPLNAIVQAAWAIVLAELAQRSEVVFGATFSGRPAELDDVERMVGAFVNNLPVRVMLDDAQPFEALALRLQADAVALSEHQHLPLREIQELGQVPLRAQLFESLLVFQNYAIDDSAMQWTPEVGIRDFTSPVRTNYPLTLVVKPGRPSLDLDLIFQGGRFDDAGARALLDALCDVLTRVAAVPSQPVSALRDAMAITPVTAPSLADVPRSAERHPPITALQRRIAKVWERAFGISDVGIDENFFDLGGHSLLLIRVHALLCRELDRELSVVDVFSNPTVRKLAAALEPAPQAAPRVARATRDRTATDDIAVIGMSGRFPGAASVDEFWRNLLGNVESIVAFSDDELRAEGLDPVAMRAAGHYVQRRGQLANPDLFDAAFFGISPNEAAATDPQQRLFLETAWSALEDAGYAPSRVRDRIGVFAGMSNNTYYDQYVQGDTGLRASLGDLLVMMGNEKDYLATRTAYKLNLSGPALNIYTACSTSLVAMAEAIHALRGGRCEMAIAGAVSVTFPQNRGYYHEDGGITSPDGHVRPFDASAAGTVFSNGIAAVILKPLDRALADGDTVHAVIKGVGINNDGSDKVSFTAPSVAGQAGAIREAYEQAGVSPDTIGYVEAHGTATALGDPIEFEALVQAYREHTDRVQFAGLGSVKSNVGHLDAAAGMAGFIKATLALREGVIPATLHFQRPLPSLRIEQSPFRIVAQNEAWVSIGAPRRAGVSSFGVGGTNAHVVLEEAPAREPSSPSPRERELILLSAKTGAALQRQREQLADFLERHPATSLPDLAFTLATGRELFSHRFAITAATTAEAVAKLRAADAQGHTSPLGDLPVAFLFPGQGAQFAGMGRQLYEAQPVFRDAVDACATILQPLLNADIRVLLFDASEAGEALLNQTRITQPALFVMSYGLGKLWQAHGVQPHAMLGHSVGEYAAACLSGALPLDAALRLIAARGRLVNALPGGAMLSIRLGADAVRPLLADGVEIAAINSPVMTVVSGTNEAIAALAARLERDGVPHRDLRTSHAFHSAMMAPVVDTFRTEVAGATFAAPQVPFVSNVTGTWATADDIASPDYWAGHIRATVQFAAGVRTLAADRTIALLEVGPGRSCTTFAKQSITDGGDYPAITTLAKDTARETFLDTVGTLWAAGGRIGWSTYFAGEVRRRISLPTYPFERKRFWPNARTLVLPLAARQQATPMAVTPTVAATPPAPASPPAPVGSRRDRLVAEVREQIGRVTGFDDVAIGTTFLDLGLDSLLIGQAAATLSRHFGTRITFKHLMDDHDSVQKLAGFLDATLDASRFQPVQSAPVMPAFTMPMGALPVARDGSLDDRVARLEAMLQQLMPGAHVGMSASVAPAPARKSYAAGQLHKAGNAPVTFGPFRPVATGGAAAHSLTAQQQAHLDALIAAYAARTPKSKANIADSRAMLADPRAGAGFNRLWKEMVYPVVSTRSQGAQLWDLDDNRWIDVTLGFGLGLFGHRPDFVVNAVAEQLATGFEIGPSSPLAGEVAKLLCEVSGKDRATFCDTGSEAVTAAIRIARTVSQRDKIAVFQGSYHGIFDEVLGRPTVRNGELTTAPIAPGITDDSLANILILEYGNPESLEFIRKYADELAAVLVEPVQSRRPDLQPREFLHQLRALTAEHEIALVFDEVVTGFRCHPNGAQAVFGVDADLVTYGKVMGGGMPIGALAGRKKYMDALDGGAWNYGDDSGPDASVTFFAGTFVRHPLVLAAAKAVLMELKARGPALQETLDRRTEALVLAMNAFADSAGVPVKVTRFSSMFMINFAPGLKYASLFFYHMRLRGVHIWETRPSFLSVAHTDDDVAAVLAAFRDSITALQDGGFFPGGAGGDVSPVTPEQEELVVTSAMGAEHSRAFNESISIRFDGTLDRSALDTAVRAVVTRHESLRAVFERDGSAQRFVPANHCGVTVTDIDLRHATDDAVSQYRDGVITAEFRLHEGPLVRFHLLALGDTSHELLIVAHHAVCDGWSFGVIYEDLLAQYRVATGVPGDVPAATPFRDFVDRQALPDVVQARAEDTAYWVERLASLPPTLALPADLRDGTTSFASRAATRLVPDDLGRALLAFCRERRVTPYTLFFAAYRDTLARISAQDAFCIGTPVASQAAAGLPGLCGHGVHFLPLPCLATPGISVGDFLADNRGLILDSLDRQQTTLSRILRELPAGRRLPPVSVTFTLETTSPSWTGDGIAARLQVNPKLVSTFDLSLYATDDHGRFSLLANARADRFSSARVEGWLDLMIDWLAAVVHTDPATPLAALPIASRVPDLAPADVAAAPSIGTETVDVVSLFEAQARRAPASIALRSRDREYSYAAVDRLANALGRRLAAAGVSPGSRVMLDVERSAEFVIAVVAILKCGAAYVPIDPAYPAEHKRHLREDASPSLTLDEATMSRLFDGLLPEESPPPARATIRPDDLAYVMFTSGSTGRPKGVMVPHRGIARLVQRPGCIDISSSDVFLFASPLSFDASTLEIWGALLNGACLAIPEPGTLTIHEIAESLGRYGVSIMWLTSGLFQAMIDERPSALSPLRILLAGGDVLSMRHVARALDLMPATRLVNGYGPTENTTFTTLHEVTRADLSRTSIPIGRPVPGTTVVILDEQLRPVPAGVAGELCTGGAGLALGYLNRPELTAAAFVPNPDATTTAPTLYRTGDRCRMLPDGEIEFVGRIDQQVKIRGFRIEPGEVEAVIAAHPRVSACRVVVQDDAVAGKSLVAFCTGDASALGEIMDAVQRALPRHMHPASVVFVEALPLSPTGKVDNRALLAQMQAGMTAPTAAADGTTTTDEPPATATERALHRIWSELLGRQRFSVTDTFFDLGGHSLLGLRLFNRLETEFGFVSPLAVLFEHPTIRTLATEIDRKSAATVASAPAPTEPVAAPVTSPAAPVNAAPSAPTNELFATLRRDGRDAPLFLIHGGDGGVMFYHALVAKLAGVDCPVYAIESPSLNRRDLDVPDLDTLVSDYLAMIRAKQPEGPYRIGGYSFGGIIAFEIAGRLEAQGIPVRLVIFDSANPVTSVENRHGFARRVTVAWRRFGSDTLLVRCGKILGRIATRRSDERAHQEKVRRCSAAWTNGTLTSLEDRAFYLNELHQQLLVDYAPRRRVSNALLVKSSADIEGCDLPADYGWGPWIGQLEMIMVPGDHLNVFAPAAVDTLVPGLQGYLA
ncbi:MAG: amino acid adenylation domain-containing protein [Gemmatimonadaceae bacterium]|nr:amino acid adenylation domain-containing protein [Gemmatimonadaceae bacterium]